jgi:hypothetical protein
MNQEQQATNLTFGQALNLLMCDKMMRRAGWNGKGMFIYKTIGNTVAKDFIPKFASLPVPVKVFLEKRGQDVVFNPSLTMYTADGTMQPGWLASQTDMLASDWEIVEP